MLHKSMRCKVTLNYVTHTYHYLLYWTQYFRVVTARGVSLTSVLLPAKYETEYTCIQKACLWDFTSHLLSTQIWLYRADLPLGHVAL